MRRLAIAVLLALAATPAVAAAVLESELQVTYSHGGESYAFTNADVPLLPGNACYAWYVRLDSPGAPVRFEERLTLPVAIDWGTPPAGTVLEDAGRIAVTALDATTDSQGWFTHGWCAAEGDPTGPHLIEVSIEGQVVASFPFEVVPAEAYDYPTPVVPERAQRSANSSW